MWKMWADSIVSPANKGGEVISHSTLPSSAPSLHTSPPPHNPCYSLFKRRIEREILLPFCVSIKNGRTQSIAHYSLLFHYWSDTTRNCLGVVPTREVIKFTFSKFRQPSCSTVHKSSSLFRIPQKKNGLTSFMKVCAPLGLRSKIALRSVSR